MGESTAQSGLCTFPGPDPSGGVWGLWAWRLTGAQLCHPGARRLCPDPASCRAVANSLKRLGEHVEQLMKDQSPKHTSSSRSPTPGKQPNQNASKRATQTSLYRRRQFSPVAQACPTLVTPWTAARQASVPLTNSQSLLKLTSMQSLMASSHLILCRPLLLLPSALGPLPSGFEQEPSPPAAAPLEHTHPGACCVPSTPAS